MSYFRKHYHEPGTAPGTLVQRSPATTAPLSMHLTDYTEEGVEELDLDAVQDCVRYLERDSKTWVQINGAVGPDTLRQFGDLFGLHDLALEDVLNAGQRPKIESYDQQLFVTAAFPRLNDGSLEIVQISLFVGENYLICFCPLAADPFDPIRKRIRQPNGRRFTSRGIDYLLYALLDFVVDSGFPVLESFGDDLEVLESELLAHPDRQTLAAIHRLKRELLLMRRILWPQREMIASAMRTEDHRIKPETLVYLRDCMDHSVQIIELLESFRDMATSMLDLYLSAISNRTNDTMRVLTIIATIFIPLTFIVGVYGMNFGNPDNPWAMPELYARYGYPLVWGVMLVMTGALVWYFRRRRWL
ncbi:magnesium and cobalt transport protein CorA [Marinobacter sp. R17]|uniref:magnesium/cobalt transporter CorA n=1 Tax=Marinobacter sp. R17 TaxID=2484250 RepID=UPI000F4C7FD9|nr:magnesium/cobalt transporter CorA [Marinobacter sp. R17]ROU01320.1 magnesium and cobalt transport protein CorA [Marinobacter sp. R17]